MNEKDWERLKEPLRDIVGGEDIWFGKDIPRKKLDGAIKSYAGSVNPDRVIALHDSTIFGGGGEGFLVTDAAFYCKGFQFTDAELRFENIERWTLGERTQLGEKFVVELKDGGRVTFALMRMHGTTIGLEPMKMFIEGVLSLQATGALASEDRFVIVQDMSQEFRVAYVKMAVYLALADDNEVDAGELAEIQLLMTRLDLSPDARRQVWRFLSSPEGPPAVTLRELESLAPKGAWPVLALSLLKDLIGVSRRRRTGGVGASDPFVVWVGRKVDVNPEQLAFIEEVLAFDDAVLSGKAKASQIKSMGAEVAAKAGAVGVPLVAIYLSGSVVGLSAAGITSGLAALGLGGLFGLSAMVTGIGVVLVVGVGVYKLVRWLSGSEEKELAELRERMMQEVMKQLQRTVNALIEDLTLLTQDVVDLSRQGEIDQARLRRLAQEVSALTSALSRLAKRQQPSTLPEATA